MKKRIGCVIMKKLLIKKMVVIIMMFIIILNGFSIFCMGKYNEKNSKTVLRIDKTRFMRSAYLNDIDAVDYIIITTDEFENEFDVLANWKENRARYTDYKNINTMVITVDDIIANSEYWVNGTWGDNNPANPFYNREILSNYLLYNDTQAKIRNCIRHMHFENGVRYVLIGGDADIFAPIIPCRKVNGIKDGEEEKIPSDLYYGCLDGNWDDDNDGVFGEKQGTILLGSGHYLRVDEADYIAEVYVGRAPVDSIVEVKNFVRKTVSYEFSRTSDEYLKHALMIAPHTRCTALVKDIVTEIIPQFTTTKAYCREGTYTKEYILSVMESGVHIVGYGGHSSYDEFNMPFGIDKDDVENLGNRRYFFVYTYGCDSAAFDNVIGGEYINYDSIGEYFVVSSGGAFAYIGNSRVGVGCGNNLNTSSETFERRFYDVLTDGITNIGKALQHSKEELKSESCNNHRFRWTYFSLNLLGDPETQLKIDVLYPTAHFDLPYNKPIDSDDDYSIPLLYEGVVAINGTATRGNMEQSDFHHYTVEYGQGVFPDEWVTLGITMIDNGLSEMLSDLMAYWDTTQVADGIYTLRLSVYDTLGRVGKDQIRVRIANDYSVYNIDKGTNYTTIQAAVDDSNSNDTIFVGSRIYYEKLFINKELTLIGENMMDTIIDGFSANNNVVNIWGKAKNMTMKGFTIQNSDSLENYYLNSDMSGIAIYSNNATISDIILRNNSYGITIFGSRNIITNCSFVNNGAGIKLMSGDSNIINTNYISGNLYDGVRIYRSSYNNLTKNIIKENVDGVSICSSSENIVLNNTISNNNNGINLFFYANDNVIVENIITQNQYGFLSGSSNIDNNLIYHNSFIDNLQYNAYDESTNIWYNDILQEGNYWSDFVTNPGYPDVYEIPPYNNIDLYPLT